MKKKSMLIVAILLMSIGFASISTTLIINGNAKVSENNEDFSVTFTAASLDGKDVYSSVVNDTKKTISFITPELSKVGDDSVLTYEVTNNSSQYDAEIKVTCVPKDGVTKYTSIKNKLDNDTTVVKAKETLNGTLTVTLDKVGTEEVSEEYICKLEFNAVERDMLGSNIPDPVSFTSDSWTTIQKAVQTGNTSKYNVGDTKEVDLGDLGTHTVRISNMSECTNGETSETACGFVAEFADIISEQKFNNAYTNVGGWRDSAVRAYMNQTIYNFLPKDLQSVISSTKVISSHGSTSGETNFETQDKLYLLSAHEVYENGANNQISMYDTTYNETRQLDYYKNSSTTTSNYATTIKRYNGTDSNWWLRSAHSDASASFLSVSNNGSWSAESAFSFRGISPSFRIG